MRAAVGSSLLLVLAHSSSVWPATSSSDLTDREFLVPQAIAWQQELEQKYRPDARPLTQRERETFAPYFAPELLATTRVAIVPQLENPGFYEHFASAGEPPPIDFSRMSGLALIDTVLIVESRLLDDGSLPLGLLFHELVHVAQNRVLGWQRAVELYVDSWLDSGSYRAILHEQQAYELAARFSRGETPFSVEADVDDRFSPPR